MGIASCFMTYVMRKLTPYIIKIKKRNKIILLVLAIILVIILIVAGLQLKEQLVVTGSEKGTFVKYKIPGIMGNLSYTFQFDMDANTNTSGLCEPYTIYIIEENCYNDTIKEHYISFGEFVR